MNEVYENIMSRRSVRAFTDRHISKDDLLLIAKAGVHAPTGMNRQTWRFTIINRQERIQTLAKAIAKQLDLGEKYCFYQPDAIILVSNEKENPNGLADSACALENIFLMANSIGIGSVWINQMKLICEEPEIRTLLNSYDIPSDHTVYGIAALGYEKDDGSPNEKNESVIHFIED